YSLFGPSIRVYSMACLCLAFERFPFRRNIRLVPVAVGWCYHIPKCYLESKGAKW
ncbi:hypothetical protein U1Q18_048567, partial [Sarracenia purpurea var. burkii]